MRNITLLLETPQGHELGQVRLPDVAVAAAGETGGDRRPRLDQEMADLDERILGIIQQEGMEPAVDLIDFRIVVSRALLREDEGEEILIRIPVCDGPPRSEPITLPSADGFDRMDSAVLDGLFDLDPGAEEEASDA